MPQIRKPTPRLLSVLTPVHTDGGEHLEETCESVLTSRLPDGWSLEWCVQEDGPAPCLDEVLPADDRVRYGRNGRQFGCAVTRNYALARSKGELVVSIDGDDVWLPGALEKLVTALLEHPEAAWAAGRDVRWHPDGTRTERPDVIPAGVLQPGELYRAWQEHGRSPFTAATTMLRAEAVLELGGWPGVGRMDDAALLYPLSCTHPGVYLAEPTFLYRQWTAQNTQQEWSEALRAQTCEMVVDRCERILAARSQGPTR